MKQVLTLSESAELELLKTVLEEGGIQCVLKNQEASKALTITPFKTELWVLNDKDFPSAQELCNDWFAPASDDINSWDCPHCGQMLGSQFDSCWKCGTKREIAGQPKKKGAIKL
jgi:hypothetical protein